MHSSLIRHLSVSHLAWHPLVFPLIPFLIRVLIFVVSRQQNKFLLKRIIYLHIGCCYVTILVY